MAYLETLAERFVQAGGLAPGDQDKIITDAADRKSSRMRIRYKREKLTEHPRRSIRLEVSQRQPSVAGYAAGDVDPALDLFSR